MIISGNHDSPERINFASRLLSDKRIYFYGTFDGSVHKCILNDEYGEVNFYLLPFIKPMMVRGMIEDAESENYYAAVSAILKTADIDYSARNVLVSHQFYTRPGVTPMLSDSEMKAAGGLDAIDAGIISAFDYAALGHLHGGQGVGSDHIRYGGSPVKYSLSEMRQEKAVTLVEMGAKGSVAVTALPVCPIHEMREIRGGIDILMSGEIASLADTNDYMSIILTDEEEIIDPMNKLRSVYPNIMKLDFDNSRTGIDISTAAADMDSLQKLSAFELFEEFFLTAQGSAMSGEQAEIVRSLLEGAV